MNAQMSPLTWSELGVIAIYLLFLLAIGLVGWRSRRTETLSDFYLGGQSTGLWVLILTLYATQYSGNTLLGFTGKTYRVGFSWTVSVQFMTAIVVAYLAFAPRLFGLSRKHGFLTPSDYLKHRFNYPPLTITASCVMVVAIGNFLLAQMMAMGKAVEGLFKGNEYFQGNEYPVYCGGVLFLAGIILIYETLGGFRAVAWTDAIQGFVLMLGFIALLTLIFHRFGSLEIAMQQLEQSAPESLAPPDWLGVSQWLSYLVIVALGCSLYPQAIQRIYSAKNAKTLRLSLIVMVFLPLVTTTVSLVAGMMGRAFIPDLSPAQTDSLLTILCREVQLQSEVGRWLVVVLFAAILAAIMSTADSIILSISSMITKDHYAGWWRTNSTELERLQFGKLCGWLLIVLGVLGAIALRDTDLVTMLDRKLDLLVQLCPAFMISLYWRRLEGRGVVLGLVVGIVVAIGLVLAGYAKPFGVHAGLYGLAVNLLLACGAALRSDGCETRHGL